MYTLRNIDVWEIYCREKDCAPPFKHYSFDERKTKNGYQVLNLTVKKKPPNWIWHILAAASQQSLISSILVLYTRNKEGQRRKKLHLVVFEFDSESSFRYSLTQYNHSFVLTYSTPNKYRNISIKAISFQNVYIFITILRRKSNHSLGYFLYNVIAVDLLCAQWFFQILYRSKSIRYYFAPEKTEIFKNLKRIFL